MVSGSLSMASDGTVSHLISKKERAEIRDDKQEGIDLYSRSHPVSDFYGALAVETGDPIFIGFASRKALNAPGII